MDETTDRYRHNKQRQLLLWMVCVVANGLLLGLAAYGLVVATVNLGLLLISLGMAVRTWLDLQGEAADVDGSPSV